MYLGIIGIDLWCPAVVIHCFVELSIAQQCIADVAIGAGIIGLVFDCSSERIQLALRLKSMPFFDQARRVLPGCVRFSAVCAGRCSGTESIE